jgi:hypothetical protein
MRVVASHRQGDNVEKFGTRDLSYNHWHRELIREGFGMIDIDSVQMCTFCQEPLALIETAADVGQSLSSKKAFGTAKLARRANLPAYVILYKPNTDNTSIVGVKILQIVPERKYFSIGTTPEEWRMFLLQMHLDHEQYCVALQRNEDYED